MTRGDPSIILERFHPDGNRNRSSIFALVAFSDGKPDSTFPENAPERFHPDRKQKPLQH
jgi:hypothetical protein